MTNEVVVTDLTEDLFVVVKEKQQEGVCILQIMDNETPKQTVKKIREYVDSLLSKKHSEDELEEYALQLGAVWGDMVNREYGWQWKYIDFGNEEKGVCIVSPKTYYCCSPFSFLTKILLGENEGLDGKNDNTVMLLFNMIDGIENKKPLHNYQIIS